MVEWEELDQLAGWEPANSQRDDAGKEIKTCLDLSAVESNASRLATAANSCLVQIRVPYQSTQEPHSSARVPLGSGIPSKFRSS